MSGTGVAPVKKAHIAMDAALMIPLTIMTVRKPKRLRIGRAVAFMDMAPAALAKVRTPEANAVMPNTTCSRSGNKNTRLPAPARNSGPPDAGAKGRNAKDRQVEQRMRGPAQMPRRE